MFVIVVFVLATAGLTYKLAASVIVVTELEAKLGLRKLCPTLRAIVPEPVRSVNIAAALLNTGLVVVQVAAFTLPLLESAKVVKNPVIASVLDPLFQVKLELPANAPLLLNWMFVFAPPGIPLL